MKQLFLVTLVIFAMGEALAQTNISFRFGTTRLQTPDTSTYGTGFELQGETFLADDSGMVFALGQTTSESGDKVNQDGDRVPVLSVTTAFLNLGAFYYITEPLRVSGGLSYHNMYLEESDEKDTDKFYTSLAGPFATIQYLLRLSSMALGAEYTYSQFGKFSQSNISLILGISF